MTISRGFDPSGAYIYTDSATGQSTADSSAYDAQQALTPDNLTAAYQQVYGSAPTADWLKQTQETYNGGDVTKVLQDLGYSKATSSAADALGIPNTMGSDSTMASGAAALQNMGATPDPSSPSYQGVPTTWNLNGQQFIYGNTNNGRDTSSAAWMNASALPTGVSAMNATAQTPQDWSNAKLFGLGALGLAGAAALTPALGGTAALTSGAVPASLTNGALATEAAYEAGLPAAGQGADALVNGIIPATASALGTGLSAAEIAQLAMKALPPLLNDLTSSGTTSSGQGSSSQGLPTSQSTSGQSSQSTSSNGPWNNNGNPLQATELTWSPTAEKPITAGDANLQMLLPNLDPSLMRQFAMNGMIPSGVGGQSSVGNTQQPSYYTYGSPAQTTQFTTAQTPLSIDKNSIQSGMAGYAGGGGVLASFRDGGQEHVPEFITGATGHYVKGRGDGQSDDIPAMLADGEYVFDADTVAQLGNGSSDAGAAVLDKMRESIRHHKRSANIDEIPPKAKSPLEYLKEGMKMKGKRK